MKMMWACGSAGGWPDEATSDAPVAGPAVEGWIMKASGSLERAGGTYATVVPDAATLM